MADINGATLIGSDPIVAATVSSIMIADEDDGKYDHNLIEKSYIQQQCEKVAPTIPTFQVLSQDHSGNTQPASPCCC